MCSSCRRHFGLTPFPSPSLWKSNFASYFLWKIWLLRPPFLGEHVSIDILWNHTMQITSANSFLVSLFNWTVSHLVLLLFYRFVKFLPLLLAYIQCSLAENLGSKSIDNKTLFSTWLSCSSDLKFKSAYMKNVDCRHSLCAKYIHQICFSLQHP